MRGETVSMPPTPPVSASTSLVSASPLGGLDRLAGLVFGLLILALENARSRVRAGG